MKSTLMAALALVSALRPVSAAEAGAPAAQRFELTVVGVYRPVDLEGRTIATPREVYLQARGEGASLADLVGRTLTVHRRVPVPASVPMKTDAAEPEEATAAAEVVHPAPATVPSRRIEVEVGRLEVVSIRGDVAIARVRTDGVRPEGDQPPATWVELPAVLVGDVARLVVAPPPLSPPPPLSAEERRRLEAEREALERDLARRGKKRPPYERKVMKWKL